MEPLAVMVFVVFALGCFIVLLLINKMRHAERAPIERRIANLVETKAQEAVVVDVHSAEEKKDLREVFDSLFGKGLLERTDKLLLQADIPLRATEFMLMRAFLMVGLPPLMFLTTANPWITAAAAGIGIFGPGAFVKFRVNQRVDLFSKQLSDFLSLVVNGLRAGQTFLQGIEHATHDAKDPIAGEFKRLLRETNLGLPIETAFENLCVRVPSADLQITATVYLIQRNVGGNLAEVMDQVGATIRERVKLQGQIKVLTAQGVMSGSLVGALPVVLCLVLNVINPNYMRILFEHPTGKACLAGGIVMQIIGCVLIKKIVTIDL